MYDIYLGIALNRIDVLNEPGEPNTINEYEPCFTAIDEDLHTPKEYYIEADNIQIIFDS